ncbi:hydroxymethylglutaryl-CoA synthase [Paragonimus westermani]|uniref:Hydroxymethylglutaryl-CoA synthase n=1 Tax=Paragonimus westermani TaxID=34504 RepID=A0A5J4NLQ8_9TREM|nr:hydroxymethylglutaryl-CoA synthase [Paragonimus westermani]
MHSKDFGIIAFEVHFPRYYIAQTDLEVADECIGKYTKGLEQEALGLCSVEEDICSICLTVVSNLVSRLNLDLRDVGFLEVGTETLIDKSKSTKTVLMQLFENCGNLDVEGVDVKNACFGGTAALFHALNWLESSAWDGRLALVVAADIAVYGTKATRPTGGAGAVAMLLGPNAPLVIDPGLASTVSVISQSHPAQAADGLGHPIDFVCFHSPFTRLVRKAFGWLALDDVRRATCVSNGEGCNGIGQNDTNRLDAAVVDSISRLVQPDSPTLDIRETDSICMKATADLFTDRVEPGLVFARQVGNMYTASLYTCLVSLLLSTPESRLRGRRVLLYSYGSGLASAMFSLRIHQTRTLSDLCYSADSEAPKDDRTVNPIFNRLLTQRTRLDIKNFEKLLADRSTLHNAAPFKPTHRPEGLFPGSYFLDVVDEQHRRTYKQVPSCQP